MNSDAGGEDMTLALRSLRFDSLLHGEQADDVGRLFVEGVARRWTVEDLEHLPDHYKYEIHDGRLIVMSPAGMTHGQWVRAVLERLYHADPGGWYILTDFGLVCGDHDFIPDVTVLPPNAPKAESSYNAVVPALVVEVESPSTRHTDRGLKYEEYAKAGIPSYWRLERRGRLTVGRLDGTSYVDTVYEKDEEAALTEPFPVTIPPR